MDEEFGEQYEQRHIAPIVWFGVLVVAALVLVYVAFALTNGWWPFGSTPAENTQGEGGENQVVIDGEIGSWETYINEELGFAVDYPSGWGIFEEDDLSDGGEVVIANFDYESQPDLSEAGEDAVIATFFVEFSGDVGEAFLEREGTNATLDGVSAAREITQTGEMIWVEDQQVEADRESSGVSIFTVYDDTFYHLEVRPYSNLGLELYEGLVDSFEFLEDESIRR